MRQCKGNHRRPLRWILFRHCADAKSEAGNRARSPESGRTRRPLSDAVRNLLVAAGVVWTFLMPGLATAQSAYSLFESGPVRPLALSPDGSRLFVANTPDGHLEIFDVGPGAALTPAGSVAVGLEPVAVAARTDSEVWVVNHLSDSVSIVDVSGVPRVVRTLLVGDEPRDIVFAGPGGNRAFVAAAHRGQNAPVVDGDYAQPGIGRADVYVFDALALGDSLEGDRLAVLTFFGDRPRALAKSLSGDRVYVAVFRSGNQTAIISEKAVCDTSAANAASEMVQGPCGVGSGVSLATAPGGLPTPHKNHEGTVGPETGLIVKKNRDGSNSGQWLDELGRSWNGLVKFDLLDQDVFAIDANAGIPAETGTPFSGVGTSIFNMATHPVSGKLFVTNTESMNHVRFEGTGDHVEANGLKPPGEPASVRGQIALSRVTVLDPATGAVTPRHLNKHIPYGSVPMPADVKPRSLATPLGLAFSADGQTVYVAGFGSSRIGVYDVPELEAGTFTVSASDHIGLAGGGPTGLLRSGNRLFVTTRFDNALRVIDLVTQSELQRIPLPNPEPSHIREGRRFLYDANMTSSNGEAACASCHLFGDMDDLAWDLGDPDGDVALNQNPFATLRNDPGICDLVAFPICNEFHPNKGPMTTQSLRGMANMGPQHWRGDRQGDEIAAFEAFNVAFPGLIGRDEGLLTAGEMTSFREFALELRYPPNPIRALDNTLRDPGSAGPNESDGAALYGTQASPGPISDSLDDCQGCHTLNAAAGHFGGNGDSTFDALPQAFKVPHLRNMYQKVGMFGFQNINSTDGPFTHQGPQIRGFGFSHDGSFDTLFRFVSASVFNILTPEDQEDLEAFMMAFPSDFAPIVGQQVTLTQGLLGGAGAAALNQRADLLLARAAVPFSSEILGSGATECDLVARVVESGDTSSVGYLRQPSGQFLPDDGTAAISAGALRAKALVPGQELTLSCVPPGSGQRVALDRDEDGLLNGLDNCPAAPNTALGGTCTAGDPLLLAGDCLADAECGSGGVCSLAQEDADADLVGDACETSLVPEPGFAWGLFSACVLLVAGAQHRRVRHAEELRL